MSWCSWRSQCSWHSRCSRCFRHTFDTFSLDTLNSLDTSLTLLTMLRRCFDALDTPDAYVETMSSLCQGNGLETTLMTLSTHIWHSWRCQDDVEMMFRRSRCLCRDDVEFALDALDHNLNDFEMMSRWCLGALVECQKCRERWNIILTLSWHPLDIVKSVKSVKSFDIILTTSRHLQECQEYHECQECQDRGVCQECQDRLNIVSTSSRVSRASKASWVSRALTSSWHKHWEHQKRWNILTSSWHHLDIILTSSWHALDIVTSVKSVESVESVESVDIVLTQASKRHLDIVLTSSWFRLDIVKSVKSVISTSSWHCRDTVKTMSTQTLRKKSKKIDGKHFTKSQRKTSQSIIVKLACVDTMSCLCQDDGLETTLAALIWHSWRCQDDVEMMFWRSRCLCRDDVEFALDALDDVEMMSRRSRCSRRSGHLWHSRRSRRLSKRCQHKH